LTHYVWMGNALALVIRMPNTVVHVVRTVAIYLAIYLSEGGGYPLTLVVWKAKTVPIFI
jgi:hypothetical protein